jgi:hypothetical protein
MISEEEADKLEELVENIVASIVQKDNTRPNRQRYAVEQWHEFVLSITKIGDPDD